MSPIKRWDGQEVHKGQNQREKSGVSPEDFPVPACIKDAAESHQASHLGSSGFAKKEPHGQDVFFQRCPGQGEAVRERFTQGIGPVDHLEFTHPLWGGLEKT